MQDEATRILNNLEVIDNPQDRVDYLEAVLRRVFNEGSNVGVNKAYDEVEFALIQPTSTEVH